MSNYHAYLDDHIAAAPVTARIAAALETVLAPAGGLGGRLVRWARDYRSADHIARKSDHLLRDIGFERDWDGSVLSRRNDGAR